jgi:hypothetical protein
MSGTAPEPATSAAPPAPPAGWTLSRVLAFIAGALVLALILYLSRGMALVGLLAMLVLVRVQSGRGRRASRAGAWVSSCVACAAGIIVFMAYGVSKLPPGMMDQVMDSVRAQQQRTPPPTLPPALERLQPHDSASRAAQRAAQVQALQMVGSPAFMRYVMVIGMSLGAAMMGAILGTAAWAGAFLLARGYSGAWPLAAPPPPAD